ncbi:hypothetical protein [Candidatus Finniella inopinata]|uniref:Uncharacterized protein n=1 Tax=Candidatus Finniella inopinata TaxID=1696036 RepID=A0A4Q7DJX6_9PROT|nr:hypothetical protein [Candidatus Finniella inopinata]RZI46475.1 hypothetical protein EQU50_02505 [Candidatus Finniella inopinata]
MLFGEHRPLLLLLRWASQHPAASMWGTDAGVTPITSGTATFGGYGTVYAQDVTFSPSTGGGPTVTWLIGIDPTGTTPPCGVLNMTGALTLPTNIEVDGVVATPFPDAGYTVARGYTLSVASGLGALNHQLSAYSLVLQESPSPYSLLLKKTVMVTFEAPGFYSGRPITRNGEGLLVRYGLYNSAWTGPTGSHPFFSGATTDITLDNRYKTTLSTENTLSSGTSVTPLLWTGSAAFPTLSTGQAYAWQLWRSDGYQTDNTNHGWLAQGLLTATDMGAGNLNITYQITPNEGHNSGAIVNR